MAARTSTRPGRTGTTTPTSPTTMARPTSTSVRGARSRSPIRRSLAGRAPGRAGLPCAGCGQDDGGPPPAAGARRRVCVELLSASALRVGSDRRRLAEPVGLVLDRRSHIGQRRRVLAPVVGAEQQLAPTREDDAHVGLSPAAVAPVGRGEGAGGEGCGHDTFLLLVSGAPVGCAAGLTCSTCPTVKHPEPYPARRPAAVRLPQNRRVEGSSRGAAARPVSGCRCSWLALLRPPTPGDSRRDRP